MEDYARDDGRSSQEPGLLLSSIFRGTRTWGSRWHRTSRRKLELHDQGHEWEPMRKPSCEPSCQVTAIDLSHRCRRSSSLRPKLSVPASSRGTIGRTFLDSKSNPTPCAVRSSVEHLRIAPSRHEWLRAVNQSLEGKRRPKPRGMKERGSFGTRGNACVSFRDACEG